MSYTSMTDFFTIKWLLHIHTLRLHSAYAADNLNWRYSKYAKFK